MTQGQNKDSNLPNVSDQAEHAEAASAREHELAENFYAVQEVASTGPQMEGVIKDDALKVVKDPSTVWGRVGENDVPVVFPVACDSLAHEPYYGARGGMEGVFVISSAVNLLSEGAVDDLARTLENRGDIRSLVVLQKEDAEKSEESSNVSRLIHMLNESSMSEEPMIDPTSKKPVQVIHFTGLPEFSVPLEGEGESLHEAFNDMLAEGVFEALPENGTTVLRPDVLTDELVEKIWKIYDKQLDILIEDHPAYQRLDRQLVEDMLRSPTGFNIVHFVDSEPVSIFLGVTDMQTCEWLNAKLISSRYPEDTLYCPAMVTDFDKQGLNYSSNVFKLLTSVALKRGKNIRPYFECTDISAGYIPGILTKSLNETGVATIEVVEQERYKYRRLVRIPSTA